MPLAFLGAIGGFLKGLVMGLAVVVAGVFALAFLTGGDKPAPAPMAEAPRAPDPAPVRAPDRAAPAPAMPQLAQIAPDAPDLAQRGDAAPVNRLNTDALAALARADTGGDALSGARVSAPRPSSSGSGVLAPAGAPDVTAPAPIFDDESGTPLRAPPTRLAALDDGAARGGFGASGGQALAAVSGVTLPRPFDGGAAADAGFAAPVPGAPLMAPEASNMAPPADPPALGAPGPRMAALSPPGGGATDAPAFGDAAPGLGASPRPSAPGLPSPSRAPGGFGDAPALGARTPMASPAPGAAPTPGLRGGAPLIAPGARAPEAASPAPPRRIAALTPSLGDIAPAADIARGPSLPGLGAAPDGDAPAAATAAEAAAPGPAIAPAAPVQAAPEADMAALRQLIASQTGGVPLPFARPPRAEAPVATPVERLDLAAAPAATPVQRVQAGAAQPGLGPRDGAVAATPVTRLDTPSGAAPNATSAAVLGPGRMDDRRASSLVAAISTRPGSGVSAPRIVAAPGLSQDPGGRAMGGATGFGGAQTSAPRPTFGAAAPSLGGAGVPMTEDAPLVIASRGGGVVASRGADAPLLARPRVGTLPSVGAPARAQPFTAPTTDDAPIAAMDGPLLALVLHGIDPAQAADPAGPLAPLLAAKAPITLVAPLAALTDATVGARLRAMGVDLVVEADPRADLTAIAALGAVAVLPVSADGRSISMSALRRFLTAMRNKDLALFNPAPGGGATARMAMNMGLQVVNSLQRVEIRSEANMAALRSSLDRAAFDARKDGGAAIELWATPASIAEAAAWFAATNAATASPAAVSALLQQAR